MRSTYLVEFSWPRTLQNGAENFFLAREKSLVPRYEEKPKMAAVKRTEEVRHDEAWSHSLLPATAVAPSTH
ncbi:hypothetical protein BaRGS_00031440 [Batillaria attramentaria]|uniref:Uncharacterized protein n=1 Tax=Batillaria attramentaria TaxID=370345 RepID=A0ABD0JQT0_9CAEN